MNASAALAKARRLERGRDLTTTLLLTAVLVLLALLLLPLGTASVALTAALLSVVVAALPTALLWMAAGWALLAAVAALLLALLLLLPLAALSPVDAVYLRRLVSGRRAGWMPGTPWPGMEGSRGKGMAANRTAQEVRQTGAQRRPSTLQTVRVCVCVCVWRCVERCCGMAGKSRRKRRKRAGGVWEGWAEKECARAGFQSKKKKTASQTKGRKRQRLL